ncbi:hypothetical protein D3C73_690760 [compost metagenome]
MEHRILIYIPTPINSKSCVPTVVTAPRSFDETMIYVWNGRTIGIIENVVTTYAGIAPDDAVAYAGITSIRVIHTAASISLIATDRHIRQGGGANNVIHTATVAIISRISADRHIRQGWIAIIVIHPAAICSCISTDRHIRQAWGAIRSVNHPAAVYSCIAADRHIRQACADATYIKHPTANIGCIAADRHIR